MTRAGAPAVAGAPPRTPRDSAPQGKTAVLAAAGFVLMTAVPVPAIDVALRDLADAHRPQLAYDIAVNLNRLGSGGWLALIAAIMAIVLAWRRRELRPLMTVTTAFVLVVGIVQPIKLIVHRPPPHLDIVDGVSYPSGHAVNAIVWYAVICLLLGEWLSTKAKAWLRWAPPIVVTITGTYLGFHWLTDMLAGICVGLVIERLVPRPTRS